MVTFLASLELLPLVEQRRWLCNVWRILVCQGERLVCNMMGLLQFVLSIDIVWDEKLHVPILLSIHWTEYWTGCVHSRCCELLNMVVTLVISLGLVKPRSQIIIKIWQCFLDINYFTNFWQTKKNDIKNWIMIALQ